MGKFKWFGSPNISEISAMHYFKLWFRSLLLLGALALYIFARITGTFSALDAVEKRPALLGFIWLVFAIEMLFRFFPSHLESMGCQKQFARNERPTGNPLPKDKNNRSAGYVALAWLALTGLIGLVYRIGWIDEAILFLICLAFSVCDMICILFFCPFQTWFMKNKCCGSCRIYNWDYAMMFSPLIFTPSFYTWSLLALSLALLVRWEITYWRHPERFYEVTNESLKCAFCKEKLCSHKRQLQRFLKKRLQSLRIQGNHEHNG